MGRISRRRGAEISEEMKAQIVGLKLIHNDLQMSELEESMKGLEKVKFINEDLCGC